MSCFSAQVGTRQETVEMRSRKFCWRPGPGTITVSGRSGRVEDQREEGHLPWPLESSLVGKGHSGPPIWKPWCAEGTCHVGSQLRGRGSQYVPPKGPRVVQPSPEGLTCSSGPSVSSTFLGCCWIWTLSVPWHGSNGQMRLVLISGYMEPPWVWAPSWRGLWVSPPWSP